MIVIDIETTGTDATIHQMVSIGAVDFETGETFYEECRIYSSDQVTQEALNINGFTIEQITDKTKQTPVKLYQRFIKWSSTRSTLLAGHNIGSFDVNFLKKNHKRQSKIKEFPFSFRYVDLHSVAYGKFGKSYSMNVICDKCVVDREPTIHTALNGAIAEYNCFKVLLHD